MQATLATAGRPIAACAAACGSPKQQAARQQRLLARPARRAAAVAAEPSSSGSSAAQDLPADQPSTSYSSSGSSSGGNGARGDDSMEFALAMAKVAHDTKAEDITLLHVAPMVYWTRYMLICTVFSRPQLNAILAKMTKEASEGHGRRLSQTPQGTAGGWELLDYGDVVLHVMTHEQREYYALEDFYGAADEVALPFDQTQRDAVETWSKKM